MWSSSGQGRYAPGKAASKVWSHMNGSRARVQETDVHATLCSCRWPRCCEHATASKPQRLPCPAEQKCAQPQQGSSPPSLPHLVRATPLLPHTACAL